MKISCAGIHNGQFDDCYGAKGTQFNAAGLGNYSPPIEITDAPDSTVSFALFMEDRDAFPVTGGFSWVHWTACNIMQPHIVENASAIGDGMVQGLNSYISIQGGNVSKDLATGYCGMSPPDAPHIYEITVYALDCILPLKHGFGMNELFRAMDGHVLASNTIKAVYPN